MPRRRRPTSSPAASQRLLDNVLRSLTAISLMSLSATVLMGVVGATVMYVGARQILAGTHDPRRLHDLHRFLAFLVAPMFQVVGIGTQITEALAGLDRTQEVLARAARRRRSAPHAAVMPPIDGYVAFEHVNFAYDPGKPVLHDVSFESQPGHRDRAGRARRAPANRPSSA